MKVLADSRKGHRANDARIARFVLEPLDVFLGAYSRQHEQLRRIKSSTRQNDLPMFAEAQLTFVRIGWDGTLGTVAWSRGGFVKTLLFIVTDPDRPSPHFVAAGCVCEN